MNAAKADSRKTQSKQSNSAGSRDGTPGSQHNRRGGKSSQSVKKPQESSQNSPTPISQPPQGEHVPMNGFNAAEVVAMLSAGADPKAPIYKPEGKETLGKSSPWGDKAGAMANGKDFWLELRKQTAMVAANNGERRGG